MDARLEALLAAFHRSQEPAPVRLEDALRALPEPGTLPSPWETWTLIGLVRHRERQQWLADIVTTRLRGDLTGMSSFAALAQPEGVAQSGPIPGMPEWEYRFHGRGCNLTHKVDGDDIDVDFWDDTADYFDTYFYTKFLDSLRHPELTELRLRELHPTSRTVQIAVDDLVASTNLTPLPGRDTHPFRLPDEVRDCSESIEAFCTAWSDPTRRLWLAALIGDWLAADEVAGELRDVTGPRAAACLESRRQRLRSDLKVEFKGNVALQALSDLGSQDLERCLMEALGSPPSGLISVALEIIEKQQDPRWCPHVYSLFSRMDPKGKIPEPHIWMASLKFLVKQGYRTDEMFAALRNAGGTEIGEAALLALEYAPEHALPLFRKGLLDDIPMNRASVAAVLALIGKPWSLRELLGTLDASDDQEKTADARAALLETGDEDAERAVRAWEELNPHEKEMGTYLEIDGKRLGPFHTFGELSLSDRGSRIRYEMEQLHDRVMKVRNVIPPEPSEKPWWKFWS